MKRSNKLITLGDFLMFGLPGLFITGLAIWVDTAPVSLGAKLAMHLVGLAFLALLGVVVYTRVQTLKRFRIVLRGFIYIDPGDYHLVPEDAEEMLANLLERYNVLLPGAHTAFFNNDPVWIEFKPHPIEHPFSRGFKLAGYTILGGEYIAVAYRHVDARLGATAYQHELGHVILGRYYNYAHRPNAWDNDKHHEFMNNYRLP